MIFGNLLRPLPPPQTVDDGKVAALRQRLYDAGHARLKSGLKSGLAIRHVAAGSCNGCELELRATQNLIHDLTQYGLSFTNSPRHADILLITGAPCRNMIDALKQTRDAMPNPVFTIAAGDCAVDGGVFKGSPAIIGGAGAILQIDLVIPGCPPTPQQIIQGLLMLLEAAK